MKQMFPKGKTCKHVRRVGESCTLNNNCTYPDCELINTQPDIFAEDTDSKEIIRDGIVKAPENCAKDCNGPLCEGCPAFIAIALESFAERSRKLRTQLREDKPMCICDSVETTDIIKVDDIYIHVLCHNPVTYMDTERARKLEDKESIQSLDQRSILDPPFELEEDIGQPHLSGSIILSRQEFDLIKTQLRGSTKSVINERINVLRKHMDKPEKVQEILKELLLVLELSFRLDKL